MKDQLSELVGKVVVFQETQHHKSCGTLIAIDNDVAFIEVFPRIVLRTHKGNIYENIEAFNHESQE